MNDTQNNKKLLIDFIDKAYGSKSNCEIVDHFQLQIKSIIGYWNSVKHKMLEKKQIKQIYQKQIKFLDGFQKIIPK